MSSDTHAAIVNATLVISSLAFVAVVVIGYFTGASLSTTALKGLSALVGVGVLGWMILRLMSSHAVTSQTSRGEENPFSTPEER